MWRLITVIGYITLIGPPQAVAIKANANQNRGELHKIPLFWVIAIEFLMRLSLFIIAGAGIESIMGDDLFEHFNIDLFFGALILTGVLHTGFYLVCFLWLSSNFTAAATVYRLGRNMAYAIVPAFPTVGLLLLWETLREIQLADELVQTVFMGTWLLFFVAALIESAIVKRQPRGLGSSFQQQLGLAKLRQ